MISANELMNLSPITGTKVYYEDPNTGKTENGIIQTFVPPRDNIEYVFVVYESTCGKCWEKYNKFTAQRTPINRLFFGWKLKLNWDKDKLIKQAKNRNNNHYDE